MTGVVNLHDIMDMNGDFNKGQVQHGSSSARKLNDGR